MTVYPVFDKYDEYSLVVIFATPDLAKEFCGHNDPKREGDDRYIWQAMEVVGSLE